MVHIGNYYSYPMVTIQFKIILIWILLILDGFLGIELFLKKKKKKLIFSNIIDTTSSSRITSIIFISNNWMNYDYYRNTTDEKRQ